MDHLDLTIAEESRKTESVLCAISGKTYSNESVLTAFLVLKKPVMLPVDSINIDQRVVESASEEDDKIIFQRT